jgi:hypothetical protein
MSRSEANRGAFSCPYRREGTRLFGGLKWNVQGRMLVRIKRKWRATNLARKNLDGVEYHMEHHSICCGGRGAESESGSDRSGSQAD